MVNMLPSRTSRGARQVMVWDFSRRVVGICAAVAMLVGCGESQPPPGAQGVIPQRRAITQHAERGKSWMLPEAQSEDLLYASDVRNNVVDVYSYPRGSLVGALTGFRQPEGLCVDKASDVFIADLQNSRIVEYGHGDETPKATLSDPGYYPNDCSVDPTTGNLAVTNLDPTTGSGEGNVLIYVNASGAPRVLIDSRVYYYLYCSYDNKGNLYIDGNAASLGISRFDELPVGLDRFKTIGIRWTPRATKPQASGILWDERRLAISDLRHDTSSDVYEVNPTTRRIVKNAPLEGSINVYGFWIHGTTLIGPNDSAIQFWRYPGGGAPIKTITNEGAVFVGGTVSVAPNRSFRSPPYTRKVVFRYGSGGYGGTRRS
jgi:hypothetical protein